jgi:hypothetical protein
MDSNSTAQQPLYTEQPPKTCSVLFCFHDPFLVSSHCVLLSLFPSAKLGEQQTTAIRCATTHVHCKLQGQTDKTQVHGSPRGQARGDQSGTNIEYQSLSISEQVCDVPCKAKSTQIDTINQQHREQATRPSLAPTRSELRCDAMPPG